MAWVGDTELRHDGRAERLRQLVEASIELARADRLAQGGIADWIGRRPERQLALNLSENVRGDAGVKLDPTVGRRQHLLREELTHRREQLRSRRDPAAHASASSTSYSCSQTRRPIAANSTERSPPDRCRHAWSMQAPPHQTVPNTSHQRTASRSTGVPLTRSYPANRSS